MCSSKKPKAPPPPAVLPEAPRAPTDTGEARGDDDARRRRRLSGMGRTSNILTGARGITDGIGGTAKVLLGQ